MSRLLIRAGLAATVVTGTLLAGLGRETTSAEFRGGGSNGAEVALTAVYPPASLAASTVGRSVSASWTAGANATGYRLERVANGTSNSCAGATGYSTVTTTSASVLAATDSGHHLPQGTWSCYRASSLLSGTAWSSVTANPLAAVQLGVVASAVTMMNAGDTSGCILLDPSGTAGTLDCGDQIVVTFNQPIDPATGPATSGSVCTRDGPNLLYLAPGSSLLGCADSETTALGALSGADISGSARHSARFAWSNSNRTLTVTVGGRQWGSASSLAAGTWAFSPTATATALRSATGSFHVCDSNAGGGSCLPATTTRV